MDAFDCLIQNLKGEVPLSMSYMTKEDAHKQLVALSGEDWGYDHEAWAQRKDVILAKIPQASDEELRSREKELRRQLRESKLGTRASD